MTKNMRSKRPRPVWSMLKPLYLLFSLLIIVVVTTRPTHACNIVTGDFICNGANIMDAESKDKSSNSAQFRNASLFQVVFTSTSIPSSDFFGAKLNNVRFVDGSLNNAKFAETELMSFRWEDMDCDGIDMEGAFLDFGIMVRASMKSSNWKYAGSNGQSEYTDCNLDGADFQLSNMVNQQYKTTSMKGLISVPGSWSGCTFSAVNMDDSVWNSSQIIRTTFDGFTATGVMARAVKITNSEFRNTVFREAAMEKIEIVGGVDASADGLEFRSSDLKASSFSDMPMSKCMFVDSSFDQAEIIKCSLDGSESSGSTYRSSKFSDSSFNNHVMTDDTYSDSEFFNTEFTRCRATSTSFENIVGNPLSFIECEFDTVTFKNAEIKDGSFFGSKDIKGGSVSFEGADLSGSNLENTEFASANFRSSVLLSSLLRGIQVPSADFSNVNGDSANFDPYATGFGETQKSNFENAKFNSGSLQYASFQQANLKGCSFVDADLTGATFRSAQVSSTDFTDAILTEADFTNAQGLPKPCTEFCANRGCKCNTVPLCPNKQKPAANVDCAGALISNFEYVGDDFSAINLEDSVLTNVKFDAVTLNNANFRQSQILGGSSFDKGSADNAMFGRAQLRDVLFSGSSFKGTNWNAATFLGSVKMDDLDLSDSSFENAVVSGELQINSPTLNSASLTSLSSSGTLELNNAEGSNVQADQMSVRKSHWIGGAFQSSSFTDGIFDEATFYGIEFLNCDMMGSTFVGATLNNADFQASNMSSVDLSNTEVTGTSFREAYLRNGNFAQSALSSTNFQLANLMYSNFAGASISNNCDFTNAKCYGIALDNDQTCEEFCDSRGCICENFDQVPVTVTPTASTSPLSSSPSASPSASPSPSTSPSPSPTLSPTPGDLISLPESPCFPAFARVSLQSGKRVRMDELLPGTKIQVPGKITGQLAFSEVYMFGHRLHEQYAEYVTIFLGNGNSLSVSPNHYVYVNGGKRLTLASQVVVGDLMLSSSDDIVPVISLKRRMEKGVFNPHTLQGDLFVDGIKVSSYTSVVPPIMGHILLSPVRMIYRLLRWNLVGSWLEDAMPSWVYKILAKTVAASPNVLSS